ncbi:hypothetical protein [Miltoncostaea marina]|nr:hypothetical protein [Miltoncostaea marina]
MTHQTPRTVAVEPSAGPGIPLYTLVLAGVLRLREGGACPAPAEEDPR